MKKVLFVTQSLGYKVACGMGLIGDLYGKAMLEHPLYEVDLLYTDYINELIEKIKNFKPDVVIANYCGGTTPWLDCNILKGYFSDIKYIAIHHETSVENQNEVINKIPWDYIVIPDLSIKETSKVFNITRLLPPLSTVNYEEPVKPIIGYQGFADPHKGLLRLAQQINDEFDFATFKLHMPISYYGDGGSNFRITQKMGEISSIINKPGIDIQLTTEMLSAQELVNMMAKNTINCYFTDAFYGSALASSPDYALAARRPIATSKSYQLKHFWNLNPSVNIEDSSIKQIIENGCTPLEKLYNLYTKDNFLNKFSQIIENI